MGFVHQFISHPQQLWVRRANFQVHLWLGIILAGYSVVIGVTGSVLVFGLELGKMLDPKPSFGITEQGPIAELSQVIENLTAKYPRTHVIAIMAPTAEEPVFIANILVQPRRRMTIACDPITGQVIGELARKASRLDWIYDLHENLLSGRSGRVVNGIGAGLLLLLAVTGLVNWWPGRKHWPRAMRIDFRRRWRRVNFDIHSAVGFWSLGLLVMWSLTGIYFVWPADCLSLVNRLSPVVNSRPPAVSVDPRAAITNLDFHAMLRKARAVDPGAQWKGIIFPGSRRSPFQMLMSRSPGIGRDYEDTLFFNPYNSEYISIWRYGVNKSLGDWIIWVATPLHFGTHWGIAVKCLWALLGLALPALAVSGLLMYWNRFLSKRWQRLREEPSFST